MIANHIMPDVIKGSNHAANVAEGRQLPSPFTGPSLGLPLKIDEQKGAVGPSSQDLRQMQVRVDDALHAAHVALEMSKALLDRRTKFEELGSGHAGGFREYEAVRSTPESDLAEQTGHMRELAGVESSQNVGFSIPRVEELVRLQDDVSRSGRDPEDDIRGVAAGNQRRSTKGAYVLPAENQRIPRFGRDLRPSSERIHRETCEALPALRFHHIEGVVVRLQLERGRIEASGRDRDGEMEGTRPHVGVGRM